MGLLAAVAALAVTVVLILAGPAAGAAPLAPFTVPVPSSNPSARIAAAGAPDGSIVILSDHALTRLLGNGVKDAAFGAGGVVTLGAGDVEVPFVVDRPVSFDSAGRILLAGHANGVGPQVGVSAPPAYGIRLSARQESSPLREGPRVT
jgi:hypothetical protein